MLDLLNIIIFFMAFSTLFIVFSKRLVYSILALSMFSFLLTIAYFILQAPDIAITEAALGVGLSTLIFLTAVKKIKGTKK